MFTKITRQVLTPSGWQRTKMFAVRTSIRFSGLKKEAKEMLLQRLQNPYQFEQIIAGRDPSRNGHLMLLVKSSTHTFILNNDQFISIPNSEDKTISDRVAELLKTAEPPFNYILCNGKKIQLPSKQYATAK